VLGVHERALTTSNARHIGEKENMGKLLERMYAALGLGVVLAVIVLFLLHGSSLNGAYAPVLVRYLHVVFGILWIGLLWYFNFVQIPTMPKVPAELKPAVSKYIAPEALFWFRWSALLTILAGLLLSILNGYAGPAFQFQSGFALIGIGMYLGLIMAANVWFVIWPNQQRALGLVEADADTKAKSARTAMLGSRVNFVLSFPMLYAMSTFQSLPA
jgi:uncharacterized membrane protein